MVHVGVYRWLMLKYTKKHLAFKLRAVAKANYRHINFLASSAVDHLVFGSKYTLF